MCKKEQVENTLKGTKKYSNWLNSLKSDTEKRFFEVFDKNRVIQEGFVKVKNENHFLNLELAELTLLVPEGTCPSTSTRTNFEKLKFDYETVSNENLTLRKELESSGNKLLDLVSWIQKYQNTGRDGLGFNHTKKNKPKKYVDLPSDKIRSYCGNNGHIVLDCSTREERIERNNHIVK